MCVLVSVCVHVCAWVRICILSGTSFMDFNEVFTIIYVWNWSQIQQKILKTNNQTNTCTQELNMHSRYQCKKSWCQIPWALINAVKVEVKHCGHFSMQSKQRSNSIVTYQCEQARGQKPWAIVSAKMEFYWSKILYQQPQLWTKVQCSPHLSS